MRPVCLSFDIEEKFHSTLIASGHPRKWRIEERVHRIIDHLREQRKNATFFVVGEVARKYPALVRRIAASGFEVASHSFSHRLLDRISRRDCKEDIARSKHILEDLTGAAVAGFRAPSWSARLSDRWLWEHLAGLGFQYDSSLFPFRTQLFGSFANPRRPFRIHPEVLEIPPSVCRWGGMRIPYGGGFFFRLYPLLLTRALMRRDADAGKTPVLYFHPWEFDSGGLPNTPGLFNRWLLDYNTRKNWGRFMEILEGQESMTLLELSRRFTS
jgi:polysaccharide deacetylase family protein (PEP-CTERM system associated)